MIPSLVQQLASAQHHAAIQRAEAIQQAEKWRAIKQRIKGVAAHSVKASKSRRAIVLECITAYGPLTRNGIRQRTGLGESSVRHQTQILLDDREIKVREGKNHALFFYVEKDNK